MTIGIEYDKNTGEVLTRLAMSAEEDFLASTKDGDWIEIDEKHPLARGERQDLYTVDNGKLKKKTKAIIARETKESEIAEEQRRMPEFLKDDTEILNEILVEHINELNTSAGIPKINMDTIKKKLNQSREQYRNKSRQK